ncbi:3-hydroxyisobutyrate dehydrogenase [Methylobacterium sp. OT2]|uniref:3-hydroxyisobutyrate dehydrogenase n=1 Tax=Methylobacterium sp. OT2 TaxID=2813779 RepID=UPI00197B8290|nr:3-hydroxyisobutyrate dehydrogenase [Methylobacterium sp. OT2]MBN4096031.1 3-hydroxyisobutyrate dehydrogenase [Methylobacterium sp. OT2]
MATITWIGLGLMGYPMTNLMKEAGHTVRGVDIDPEAQRRARENGITVVDTIAEACTGADAVLTMLPTGKEVLEVLAAHNSGVFSNLKEGGIVVDCSTIGIDRAVELHEAAAKAGVAFVEAPVSGGTEGAAAGTLTFMLGGADEHIERVRELLSPLAGYVAHVGGPGAGQGAKVVNNLIMGVCVAVNCEATDLAQRLGLNLKALFEIVIRSSGDNWAFRLWNPAPGVVPDSPASKDYKPGFKSWLLAKDLSLALEAGRTVGSEIATAGAAHAILDRHVRQGGADMDVTSLLLSLAKQ